MAKPQSVQQITRMQSASSISKLYCYHSLLPVIVGNFAWLMFKVTLSTCQENYREWNSFSNIVNIHSTVCDVLLILGTWHITCSSPCLPLIICFSFTGWV